MKKYIFTIVLSLVALAFISCDDFLDRPPLTDMTDDTYWSSENTVRLFANAYYPQYFVGYSSGWGVDYAPRRGFNFADDFVTTGKQENFETEAPSSRQSYSVSNTGVWLRTYAGSTWNFAWVKKSNLFLERVGTMKEESKLNDEAYNHWSAVARFFRGFEYCRLTRVFGDVPYYDRVIEDNELDLLYKDRDNRSTVMDNVYDDFVYVMSNMRPNDNNTAQYLNRYIAASFISRLMLFEGTWQKYHLNDQTRAKKYLELAVSAADYVKASGNYSCTTKDFRSLFGSDDLAGHKEVILYRHYDASQAVYHHVASYSNLYEGQEYGPNLDLAKSFICNDGLPYQLSSHASAGKFDITSFIESRDPRFEATFWHEPAERSVSLLYACKFIHREGPTYHDEGKTIPPKYSSSTNTNDAPVIRYAEVLLNWIEAKAELATMGGAAVTQTDIDESINHIRKRPLDAEAISRNVQQTVGLQISAIPDDPARDSDVPALIWEIRRERRMEFVFEYSRLLDIKRWKKIEYMDYSLYPDKMLGPWVDLTPSKYDSFLSDKAGKLKVWDGTSVITYDGTNRSSIIGYYMPEEATNRDAFTDRVYLAPVGRQQISDYSAKGYTLTQTPGWN